MGSDLDEQFDEHFDLALGYNQCFEQRKIRGYNNRFQRVLLSKRRDRVK